MSRHVSKAIITGMLPAARIGSVCIAVGACAGGPQMPSLPQIAAGVDVTKIAVGSLPSSEPHHHPLRSAEVYARIARGANACWFGPRGRLSTSHILHADAAPSMNGGGVEIVVHERAVDQPKPWGYKAFRILLSESAGMDGTPGAGGTSIAVENSRIPDAEALRMRAEVFQWAAGAEGCKIDAALDKTPIAAAVETAPSVPTAKAAPGKSKAKPASSAQPAAATK